MAEFLFIFRGGMDEPAQPSPEEMQAQSQKWTQWMGELTKPDKTLVAQPLQPTGAYVKGTKKTVSDGPFTEGKEIVRGCLLLKADSLEQVIELGKSCPLLISDTGIVEIRPVQR
jgi:hypothetical protein